MNDMIKIVLIAIAESEDLYQIAILIDQLKHDDVQLRLTASKSIVPIGKIFVS